MVERPSDPATTPKPPSVPPTIVGQLVRWIPTEAITLYVAFLGLLAAPRPPRGQPICSADFTSG
jgi:hypothetical protein